MSSSRKDARWNLATTLVEKAGSSSTDLEYPTFQRVLDAAEAVLSELNSPELDLKLAIEWNGVTKT